MDVLWGKKASFSPISSPVSIRGSCPAQFLQAPKLIAQCTADSHGRFLPAVRQVKESHVRSTPLMRSSPDGRRAKGLIASVVFVRALDKVAFTGFFF